MSQEGEKPRTLFVEGLGSGIPYSFNYDTRFSNSPGGRGRRAGFGYTSQKGIRIYTLPVVVNYLLGKKKHFLELGAGITLARLHDRSNTNASSSLVNIGKGAVGTLAIGCRMVSTSGFTLRAGLTPLIGTEVEEYFLTQLSFGYSF